MPRLKLLFDVDNCMYRRGAGIASQMGHNINQWGVDSLNLAYEKAKESGLWGYTTYGLAMAGYVIRHGMEDVQGYLDYVHFHEMNHREKIEENPKLVSEMLKLDAQDDIDVFILTNGTKRHARACLSALGLTEENMPDEKIIACHEQWGLPVTHPSPPPVWNNKPHRSAYETTEKLISRDPQDTVVFIDDSYNNLKAPHEMGWKTVWLSEQLVLPEGALYATTPSDREHATYAVNDILGVFALPEVVAAEKKNW